MLRIAIFSVAAVAWDPAYAEDPECYSDSVTGATQCVLPSQVREKAGIRSAPLYTGGPNSVRPTRITVNVECKTGVMHLKDRDGVSFAGGQTNTPATRRLEKIICGTTIKKGAK